MENTSIIRRSSKFNTMGATERFHFNMPCWSKYSIVYSSNTSLFYIVTNREASILVKTSEFSIIK